MSLTLKIFVVVLVLAVIGFVISRSSKLDGMGNNLVGKSIGAAMTPVSAGTPQGVKPIPSAAPMQY